MGTQAAIASGRRTGPVAFAGLTVSLLLFSIVLVRYTDNFFADDTYFYLQVAWNVARGMGSTFNNIMPTNGYHPLWMLVCAAVFTVFHDKATAVHAVGVVLALLNIGTVALLSRALVRTGVGCWWIAWLLYVPFCFTSQLGTEGALSGCCLAAFVLASYVFALRPTGQIAIVVSLLAGLAVLSRLDVIFVVACVWMASLFFSRGRHSRDRWLLILASPVALCMWATYIATNLRWFGTVQPISGMLKSHAQGEHNLFTNLPHTAYLDLSIILPGVVILAFTRKDRFSKIIEIPFATGVLLHAAYIVLIMSSETRWSWYYTSWTLLASVVLARLGSLLLGDRRPVILRYTAISAAAFLLVAWYFTSYRRMAHEDAFARDPGFQQNVTEGAGLRTVLAFDKPGRIAFYTDTRVIPLDGLMGNLQFQKDLATRGIASFDVANGVDGFIGPPQPMSTGGKVTFCDHIFLSSVRFHCTRISEDAWQADSVEVFARLTGSSAGVLALPRANLVWTEPHYVAVWRLPSQADWRKP